MTKQDASSTIQVKSKELRNKSEVRNKSHALTKVEGPIPVIPTGYKLKELFGRLVSTAPSPHICSGLHLRPKPLESTAIYVFSKCRPRTTASAYCFD